MTEMESREIINLQELSHLLSSKTELQETDSTIFIKELFDIVSKELIDYNKVQIDDFGTFIINHIISAEEDEIDELVEGDILSYYCLEFLPDKSLSDLVNKPFVNFEPTTLNKGVNLDNVLVVTRGADKDNTLVEEESILYTKFKKPIEVIVEPEPKKEVVEEEVLENDSEEITKEEVIIPIIPIVSIDEVEDIKHDNAKVEEDTIDDHPQITKPIVSSTKGRGRKAKTALMIAVTGVIVLLTVSAFFLRKKVNYESPIIGGVDNDVTDIYISEVLDTVENVVSAHIDSIEIVSDTTQEDLKPKTEIIAKPEVVTLSMGKTLRLIALEKYGHREFWIYIYLKNKNNIPNPNNVTVGTKLIIPLKSEYGIDANSYKSIHKASELGAKELAKFN